ncbi:MAG: IS66 family insertion sequence element accessory protein TnpA [Oligoflexus sp.]
MIDKERNWKNLVAEQPGSGHSIKEYCKLQGISTASFYLHRKRLGLSPIKKDVAASPASFATIELKEDFPTLWHRSRSNDDGKMDAPCRASRASLNQSHVR